MSEDTDQWAYEEDADLADPEADLDAPADARAQARDEIKRQCQERLQAIADAAEEDRRRAQVHRDLIRSLPKYAATLKALETSATNSLKPVEERCVGPVADLWRRLDDADNSMDEHGITDPQTLRDLTQLKVRTETCAADLYAYSALPTCVQVGKKIIEDAHYFLSMCEDVDENRARDPAMLAELNRAGDNLLAGAAAGVEWELMYFDPEKGTWLIDWLCDYVKDFVKSDDCCLISVADVDIPGEIHGILGYAESPAMLHTYIEARVHNARPVTDFM